MLWMLLIILYKDWDTTLRPAAVSGVSYLLFAFVRLGDEFRVGITIVNYKKRAAHCHRAAHDVFQEHLWLTK